MTPVSCRLVIRLLVSVQSGEEDDSGSEEYDGGDVDGMDVDGTGEDEEETASDGEWGEDGGVGRDDVVKDFEMSDSDSDDDDGVGVEASKVRGRPQDRTIMPTCCQSDGSAKDHERCFVTYRCAAETMLLKRLCAGERSWEEGKERQGEGRQRGRARQARSLEGRRWREEGGREKEI